MFKGGDFRLFWLSSRCLFNMLSSSTQGAHYYPLLLMTVPDSEHHCVRIQFAERPRKSLIAFFSGKKIITVSSNRFRYNSFTFVELNSLSPAIDGLPLLCNDAVRNFLFFDYFLDDLSFVAAVSFYADLIILHLLCTFISRFTSLAIWQLLFWILKTAYGSICIILHNFIVVSNGTLTLSSLEYSSKYLKNLNKLNTPTET